MRNRVQILVLAFHSLREAHAFVRTAVAGQYDREEEKQMNHRGLVCCPSDFSALTSARRAQQAHLGLCKSVGADRA